MKPWWLSLSLDPDSPAPLYEQLAAALRARVRSGRLRPGEDLPGTRTLATELRVHRNTVLAAYRELTAEGWLDAVPQSGTRVSPALPEALLAEGRHRAGAMGALGFELAEPRTLPARVPPPARGALVFRGGLPDLRLLPVDALARAYRRALTQHGTKLLDLGDPQGHPPLRAALAEMLRRLRGLAVSADGLLVTRGSQQALDLVARGIVQPGQAVAVEDPGYRPAAEAFRAAGARVLPVPVDAHGLDIDALSALLAREPVRALYVTPHHQFPTTVTLGAARRLRLLDLARRYRVAVIEDDYDFEFHYDGRPVLPLASADPHGVVVYVGTLSKILAPGLRLGFVAGPPALVQHLTALRAAQDAQGDLVLEAAVAELLEDGLLQRHVRKMRRVYHARRDALVAALHEHLGERVAFETPSGGMSLWVRPRVRDPEAWLQRCASRGVFVRQGSRQGPATRVREGLRLGFASLDERELREAARRMAASV